VRVQFTVYGDSEPDIRTKAVLKLEEFFNGPYTYDIDVRAIHLNTGDILTFEAEVSGASHGRTQ
jgi:hypothetical protein